MTISLITATYNSAATIADTMESVLAQTYKDIDYWIIDGASTDETMAIVKSYEERFQGRLHYLSEKDRGIYDAMNKGISRCSGEIVGILNSDDFFTSDDVLKSIVNAFTDEIDAVYADLHFIRGNERDKVIRYYSSALFRPFWMRYGFVPAHPTFYARKGIFDKYGLYSLDYKIAADFEMLVRLFHKHKINTCYLKKDMVTMRVGGVSTKNIRNRINGTKEKIKALNSNGLYTNKFLIMLGGIIKILGVKWWNR